MERVLVAQRALFGDAPAEGGVPCAVTVDLVLAADGVHVIRGGVITGFHLEAPLGTGQRWPWWCEWT